MKNDSSTFSWLGRWRVLAVIIAGMWLVELVNTLLGHRLNAFGILPRDLSALPGIVFSPFLHAGWTHLASNSVALAALGALVALRGTRSFIAVTAFIVLVGGLATWLLARSALHVGASGLVFGYFGFLLARGAVERTVSSVLIALAVMGAYGGLLWGVLPSRGVSFEGHAFGLLAGAGAALAGVGVDLRGRST